MGLLYHEFAKIENKHPDANGRHAENERRLTISRLRWFEHAARRPAGEFIRDVIDPVPLTHWRRKRDGPVKTLLTMLKENLTRMRPDFLRLQTVEPGVVVAGNYLDAGSPSLGDGNSGSGRCYGHLHGVSWVNVVPKSVT